MSKTRAEIDEDIRLLENELLGLETYLITAMKERKGDNIIDHMKNCITNVTDKITKLERQKNKVH